VKETRLERRERQRTKEKDKIPQHGGSLRRIYKDAISKRVKGAKAGK